MIAACAASPKHPDALGQPDLTATAMPTCLGQSTREPAANARYPWGRQHASALGHRSASHLKSRNPMQACYSLDHVRLAAGPGPQMEVIIVNACIDAASRAHLTEHPRCRCFWLPCACLRMCKGACQSLLLGPDRASCCIVVVSCTQHAVTTPRLSQTFRSDGIDMRYGTTCSPAAQ